MPPGAPATAPGNIERVPKRNRLNRNALLLVRDGRDVMVSLFWRRRATAGTHIWEGDGRRSPSTTSCAPSSWSSGPEPRGAPQMNPWTTGRFHTGWLARRTSCRSCATSAETSRRRSATSCARSVTATPDPSGRDQLDFDKHSPVGRNVPTAYQRKTTGNWRRLFTEGHRRTSRSARGHVCARSATRPTRRLRSRSRPDVATGHRVSATQAMPRS